MKAAGYEYINIDEGWWHGQRDDAGNIGAEVGFSDGHGRQHLR